ncbi:MULTISPECIES: hypothetical protein [Pectobacterium]|uniref:hypothetical protein n=1 Tax=Pectobacterium TaxID=122277 RepID=UPI0015DEBF88|nr:MULTISPECIES: hypothetical protein [Pectobacterium]MBA0172642.1 hypothetical protein [Pectobacterium versatile]MCA6936589.1 hypothetical protein [Pectobacterium versatile]
MSQGLMGSSAAASLSSVDTEKVTPVQTLPASTQQMPDGIATRSQHVHTRDENH